MKRILTIFGLATLITAAFILAFLLIAFMIQLFTYLFGIKAGGPILTLLMIFSVSLFVAHDIIKDRKFDSEMLRLRKEERGQNDHI